jgi:glycosyltransferase involved in cell wall biosynthesis
LLALIERLCARNDVQVFALSQEPAAAHWSLAGAHIENIGTRHTKRRAVQAIRTRHRAAPFDVIHAIWSGTCGVVCVSAARLLRVPSVIHVAGGELVALNEIGYGGRASWRGRIREAVVLRAANRVTAASQPVIRALSNLGLQAERVPLGVDLRSWPSREPVRRPAGRLPRLIHLASLNRVKDQATLLQTLALLKEAGEDFHMDIVGEDTLQGEVQARAATLGLAAHVRFHGFLTQKALRPIVERADLLVMSSRHETGPMAMLEAAVVGVPTAGTAVGHIAEWSPEASVAVPVGDAAALAGAIMQLLGDENLRLRIATVAHRRAVAQDADHTARQFESVYATIIGARPRTA